VARFVLSTCDAKSPFKVAKLIKARSFGQKAAVGNAWSKGIVLSAQETQDGLYDVGAAHEVFALFVVGNFGGKMAEPIAGIDTVYQLNAKVDLDHLVSQRL
jgi:hypothetical protein